MNKRDLRYARLLALYPKSYRNERGEEILATILEAAPPDRQWPTIREALDLACHGMQRRLGLTSDRFGGRVCDRAAAPGLAMALAFALSMITLIEVQPLLSHPPLGLTPRTFLSLAALVYFGWIVGAALALVWRRHQRRIAVICVLATMLITPFARSSPFHDSFLQFGTGQTPYGPGAWQMLILACLALPAALASRLQLPHPALLPSLVAGLSVFALLALAFLSLSEIYPKNFPVHWWITYWNVDVGISRVAPWLLLPCALAIGLLLRMRRTEVAGSVFVLALPWMFVGAGYRSPFSLGHVVTGVVLVLLLMWFAIAWTSDLRQGRPTQLGKT